MFASEVQFGHAGACANAERETALAKNKVFVHYFVGVDLLYPGTHSCAVFVAVRLC